MVSKKTYLGVLLLAALAMLGVQAQTDLADWQYDQALAAFNKGDCVNASVHAKIALDRYTALGSIPGIEKTNALITKINDCIKPVGDAYYIQALNYYTKGQDYLNYADFRNARAQLDLAMTYLQLANSAYLYMIPQDASRLNQISTKMAEVNAKIMESEELRADEYYRLAVLYIQKEDYGLALEYADNASAICAQSGNTECVQKCNELITGIRHNLAVLIDRAKYFYEKGMEAYTSATCTNDKYFDALDNFKQARATYLSAREYSQVANCDYILNRTNEALAGCMQQLIKSLDDSIQEATTKLVLAGDNCSVHNDILALLKRTRDHAGVLQERFGGTVFEARQVQCDELKKKVVIAMVNCNESDKAEKMYNTAGTMFQDAEYENASVLARQAKVIFEKSGNWAGVTKADRLMDSIDKMLAKLNESNGYYQKGQSAMRIADYENASFYLLKAREMYQNISRVKDVAKCDASLSELNIGNSTKGKADALYAEAQKNYEARDFGTAQIKANAAKEMYKRINDVEGIAKVDAFLKTIPVYNDSRWLVMGLIVFVFIAFIVLMWMKTKVSREKRERTEVEDKKKFEEEQKLAELEAERKKREEEKERMMIERKRLKEMLEQEKKAIRGGASEQRAAVRQETNASGGNGFAPSADKQRVENERAMLEKMLGEERESLKKEKAVIVEQLGLRQSKDTKHDAPTENPEVISDREKIKEIVDTPTNNQPSIQQNSDGLDEIERLREMIKKERDAMKKGQ